MNDIFLKRRSIRDYITEKPVEKEKLNYILKSALYAPTAKNKRNVEFVIIESRETLLKITEFHPYSSMLKTAPMAIIVCGEVSDDKTNKDFWMINSAAATENILLAATSVDIGSVWLALAPYKKLMEPISKLLNAPKNIKPFCIVALGYTKQIPTTPERFDESKIHYESF